MHKQILRWLLVFAMIMAVTGFFAAGINRLKFETDILSSIPLTDPVLADAHHIFTHHPVHDRVVVDLAQPGGDIDSLIAGANLAEDKMRTSGLFKEVGFRDIGQLVPELIQHVIDHFPVLFDARDLEEKVKPLLAPAKITKSLQDDFASMHGLEGIGQAGFVAGDPLALRNLILSRLAFLSPIKGSRIYKGHLVSSDSRHVLIVAEPLGSGMEQQFARRVSALMGELSEKLNDKTSQQSGFILTPVGAYRAAIDNETSAKRNMERAVLISTIAIVLLLVVGFPRPFIGLLALLPAFAGTMMAVFVYSLFHSSISMLAVGFGGAIISFTVDYGIVYLLFLDRPYETRGLEATKEVWSLGLLAMLTTAVSFAFLTLSGFPALMEIGQFAAFGVVFTYVFVHAFFPLLFPVVPAAKKKPYLPLQQFVNTITSSQGIWKTYAALIFGIFMLFFARPEFHVDLQTMNNVSQETQKADKLISDVWGDMFSKVYIMIEGRNGQDLQRKCDRLNVMLAQEKEAGRLSQMFVPSMIFPGGEMSGKNIEAWRKFWNPERVSGLRRALSETSRELGFVPGAFDPFFDKINVQAMPGTEIPEQYANLLGISVNNDKSSWTMVAALTTGSSYQGEDFYGRFTKGGMARVFDPVLFGKKLGSTLMQAFIKMAAIVGIITILTAFFYFFDWQLTMIGMAPTLFAMVCTIGTLNLMGQPLGITTIMVSVVVIGMGTDYALYLIRSYQRYFDENDASLGLIRLSVFLSFATTFMGMCVLALSDNAMLKSAGLALSLGIGYSFFGAVAIVPPVLKRIFTPLILPAYEVITPGSRRHMQRVAARYRHMEVYPRFFARFKILIDPMFPKLANFVREPQTILDVGTGYGVPAVWLLELFPRARLYGIEPDAKRVRFASRVIGTRGSVAVGRAPDIPDAPGKVDTALMLDMIHLITDDEFLLTLKRISDKLCPEGSLIIRTTVASTKSFSWKRLIEKKRIKIHKGMLRFRSEQDIVSLIEKAGFKVITRELSAPGDEEIWFIASPGIAK